MVIWNFEQVVKDLVSKEINKKHTIFDQVRLKEIFEDSNDALVLKDGQ